MKMPGRSSRQRSRDYKVGYGRPPEATRFQPGRSGNPKGRRKGSKNKLDMFAKALEQRVQIEESGTRRSISVMEAIIRRIINSALKGDLKAAAFILEMEAEISHHVESRNWTTKKPRTEEEAAEAYFRLVRG